MVNQVFYHQVAARIQASAYHGIASHPEDEGDRRVFDVDLVHVQVALLVVLRWAGKVGLPGADANGHGDG